MRNDYTDYIQHAFGHRYVAKVKTASGTKYFYSQDEYNAFLHGRTAGIHQTPTRGVAGAAYSIKKKATDAVTNLRNKAALNKHVIDNKIDVAKYKAGKTANKVRGTVGSATNTFINGRTAGIHQTPTRGAAGAAYSAKRSIGNAAKKVASTVGSTPVTSKKNGPQVPASVMASHKANQASLRGKNALAKINSAKNKVLGEPDSNSNYRVAMRKIKNTAGKVGEEFNKTFGHNEKHNNMNRVEKAVMNAQNKISSLEYKVSKKIGSLIGKNKKVSPELAAKMKESVDEARHEVVNSGADSETIKMMNDKLDKILKEIESNKTVKNTGSHPAYNQGVVSYPEYKPTQGSRPTNNQGYVPKTSTLISNPSSLPQKMREQAYLDRKARNEKNMTASQKDLQKQFNNLMTVLDRNKKKKKK